MHRGYVNSCFYLRCWHSNPCLIHLDTRVDWSNLTSARPFHSSQCIRLYCVVSVEAIVYTAINRYTWSRNRISEMGVCRHDICSASFRTICCTTTIMDMLFRCAEANVSWHASAPRDHAYKTMLWIHMRVRVASGVVFLLSALSLAIPTRPANARLSSIECPNLTAHVYSLCKVRPKLQYWCRLLLAKMRRWKVCPRYVRLLLSCVLFCPQVLLLASSNSLLHCTGRGFYRVVLACIAIFITRVMRSHENMNFSVCTDGAVIALLVMCTKSAL